MPGLLLVELEGTIIYKTRKNRISMVCEKCSHFIHMNLKNWHFITWYLCEKLLICVNIYAFPFLEKYSFNFQEFHECSTIQVTRIVAEVLSYKDVCYFSIFYDMCQIWGGWGWVLVPFIWALKEYQMFCCSYLRCLILEINSGS